MENEGDENIYGNRVSKIVIAEPWDFVNTNGDNLIEGYLFNKNDSLIFKSNDTVSFGTDSSSVFILSPRVANWSLDIDIEHGLSVMNFYLWMIIIPI